MKTYKIKISFQVSLDYVVEANSKEEAEDILLTMDLPQITVDMEDFDIDSIEEVEE